MRWSAVWVAGVVLAAACSKPEPPKVTPKSARVSSIDARGLALTVELDVYNPNRFPLIAKSVSGSLEVGEGVELGRARSEPQGAIPANASSTVSSELVVSWTNAAALAPYALSNKPVPYTFKGLATIGGEKLNVDVPFTIKGELTRDQVLSIGLRGLSPTTIPMPTAQ
jgi:LEA14-like dessication related protein